MTASGTSPASEPADAQRAGRNRRGERTPVPFGRVLMSSAMTFFDRVDGYKTYIAAIGLTGLAVYQVSLGDFDQAAQTILSALAAFGLRHAVAKNAPLAAK